MTNGKKCGRGLTWNTIHRFDGPCYILDLVEDKNHDIINKQPTSEYELLEKS